MKSQLNIFLGVHSISQSPGQLFCTCRQHGNGHSKIIGILTFSETVKATDPQTLADNKMRRADKIHVFVLMICTQSSFAINKPDPDHVCILHVTKWCIMRYLSDALWDS